MNRRFLLLFFILFFASPLAKATGDEDAKLLAVQFYADWCKFCKKLKPSFDELKSTYDGKVEFVVLNYTDEQTTTETEKLIEERGLKSIVESYTGTGFILLVEEKPDGTKSAKGILDKKQSLEEMKTKIEELI